MLVSPLRYPGGKSRLFPFFASIVSENRLFGTTYCEPYAGGAGLALRLLETGFVGQIAINDIDPGIYAFWQAAVYKTEAFCNLLEKTEISIDEWHRQREIHKSADHGDFLKLGFATYFLNRTNRSGIITGAGPIGGYAQAGTWKLDARLIKNSQISNFQKIGSLSNQIKVSNLDAIDFVERVVSIPDALIYLDPPYYVKGKKLYTSFYQPSDHIHIAERLRTMNGINWVVSYDDVPEIREIYSGFNLVTYRLQYSVAKPSLGSEVMYVSENLVLPSIPIAA